MEQTPEGKYIPPTLRVVSVAMTQIICDSQKNPPQPPVTEMEEGDDNW